MTRYADHLMIAPVVLPMFAGAMMLALGGERRRNVNAVLNVATTFALVVIATRCSGRRTRPRLAWRACTGWVTGLLRSPSCS